MCGLNGIYAFNHSANPPDRAELIATRDHMAARGPDGLGEWWSDDLTADRIGGHSRSGPVRPPTIAGRGYRRVG